MKTREEIIYELTEHELNHVFSVNGDFEDSVRFFSNGGFYVYTDEALLEQWEFLFTEGGDQ